MIATEIRQILESPYDRKVWKNFLQTQFTNNKMNAEDRPIILSDTSVTEQCHSLGYYEIDTYTKIGIFEVQLNDKVNLTRNRVGLRNLIKNITQQLAGAMVVFVQEDKWRFSYISKRKVRNKETNTIEDKETAPKRYTYLFGNGEKALTAAQRFDKLIQKQRENLFQNLTLKDFEDAFSVEKLSKEFFAKYKDIYEDFVEFITGKRFVKKGSKWTETTTHEANYQLGIHFDYDEKKARDFFKRMMGRIVFLYFIQKKGWLSCPVKIDNSGKNKNEINWGEGDQDFLYNLFLNAKYKDSFYSDYLVPLFFNTFNNQEGKFEIDSSLFINHSQLIINKYFPYLNGGLFDKKQDIKYDKLALPSAIFEKLFKTFDEYNFTVHEDAPDEHTVAVDPEMLGHIFENLLEDNKDKGAFYTPKDIVHYMCRESLHNYIFTYTGNEENEDFKQRFKQYNDTYELNLLSKEEIKQIDRALEDVKICDPAIGSGAFPMGLLHEIYHLKIPIEDAKGFKAKSPADLKKHIIEESIFGVDIDSGAVDIARLRFWLSLVVEEIAPQPLPNLAFKIVCANTLIPLGKNTLSDLGGSQELARQLENIRVKYFDAKKEDKKDLERQFTNLQNKLWTTAQEWAKLEDKDIYLKILEFSPFEDKSCSWFDPWWMFGIKDGFDIVIGNPPYVQLQNNSGLLANLYKDFNYTTFARTGDIYCLFYELGIKILKPNGVLTYITSNKWMRAGYGEKTRNFFIEKTKPLLLIDFAGQKIFENATVDTNIAILKKAKYINDTKACVVKEKWDTTLDDYFNKNITEIKFKKDENWVVLSANEQSIKNKIEKIGTSLKDWDIQINYGIKTGFNEAFIIDGKKKDELIAEDPKSAEIIRPILRGRDIKKYSYDFANLWLITTHNGYTDDNGNQIDRIKIEDYPAIKKYLDSYWDQIEKRQDQGDTPYNLRNCAYMDDFSKQKIMYSEIVREPQFYLDNEGKFFPEATTFIMTGENLKYLYNLLHSKAVTFFFKLFYAGGGLGESGYRYKKAFLENLPIPNQKNQIPIITFVDYILFLHNQKNTQIFPHTSNERIASHFEDILNMMVYELYFEEHIKEVGIDVLQFITPQIESLQNQAIELQIKSFYEWYQKPENLVRQRILLIDTRSPDILAVINKS